MGNNSPRVFLAIGVKNMEEHLKRQLANEYNFVGEAIYREAIVKKAMSCNPDIIIFRETINGSQDVLDIVYDLRLQLPDARIIFLASDRKPGDPLLAELVGSGVYDIMVGNSIRTPDLITLMREPNKFSDVAIYRQKLNRNRVRESMSEGAPVGEVVKQVKETVFVEGDAPILPPNFGKKEEEKTVVEEKKQKKAPKKRNRRRFFGKQKKKEEPKKQPTPVENEEKNSLFSFKPKEEVETESKNSPIDPPLAKKPPVKKSLFALPTEDAKSEQTVKKEDKPLPFQPKQNDVDLLRQEKTPVVSGKQKILTFVGGGHGVGNSQVAFNTALSLSKQGFKTLFIELNESGSTIEYLYRLAMENKGLDYALKHLANKDLLALDKSIIRMEDVAKQNMYDVFRPIYPHFPNSLDFLFFSPDYVLESDPEKKKVDPNTLKELCIYQLFQSGYHYIVLDTEPNLHNPLTNISLTFGTHVFFTVTQDVSHIGRAVHNISEVNERINIVDKIYYIVNKFDHQANLSKKDIQEWLKSDIETFIPLENKEFIDNNMVGKPVSLFTKNKQLKKAFDEVSNFIIKQ